MSCKTRAQLETGIDDAFSDLIDNTALLCEQINTEEKQHLWIMAGVISIIHDDTTGKNTLSWIDAADGFDNINVHTLEFSTYKDVIYANFPTKYYRLTPLPTQRSFPISAHVTPFNNMIREFSNGDENAGYKFAVNPNVSRLEISATRRINLTARISYNPGTSAWGMVGLGEFATQLNGQVDFTTIPYNTTTGVLTIETSFDMRFCPTIMPYHQGGIPYFTPFIYFVNSRKIEVTWWDNTNGDLLKIIPASSAPGFCIDFGTIDMQMNMEETDFGDYAGINVLSIARHEVL